MLVMFRYIIRVDEYIIQLDHDTDIQKIRENVIHKLLKGRGRPKCITDYSNDL